MITIILHNAALELISENNCNVQHKAILHDSKRRNKVPEEILLDISVHQPAIYPEKMHNSGRPDLVHFFLLQYHHITKLLPDKIQNKIQLFVHTRNDEYFYVPNTWRVPVHFIRFRGLIEQFLLQKKLQFSDTDQLRLYSGTLEKLVSEIAPDEIINLKDEGMEGKNFQQTLGAGILTDTKHVFLIGGYQKGEVELDFGNKVQVKEIKLVDKPTTAWMIINLLLIPLITTKIE